MLETDTDPQHDEISGSAPESRGHLVAVTIAALAILGGIALAAAALLTTEIDVDDLLDPLIEQRDDPEAATQC